MEGSEVGVHTISSLLISMPPRSHRHFPAVFCPMPVVARMAGPQLAEQSY